MKGNCDESAKSGYHLSVLISSEGVLLPLNQNSMSGVVCFVPRRHRHLALSFMCL